jgi:hypothetical protein
MKRFDLISDALPFGRLWYGDANAVANAIGYAQHFSRSHHAVIRVYDVARQRDRNARAQGRFSRVTRFASLPNGFSHLKEGGHQREFDDRPNSIVKQSTSRETLTSPIYAKCAPAP